MFEQHEGGPWVENRERERGCAIIRTWRGDLFGILRVKVAGGGERFTQPSPRIPEKSVIPPIDGTAIGTHTTPTKTLIISAQYWVCVCFLLQTRVRVSATPCTLAMLRKASISFARNGVPLLTSNSLILAVSMYPAPFSSITRNACGKYPPDGRQRDEG